MKVSSHLTKAFMLMWLLSACAHDTLGPKIDTSSKINKQEFISRFGFPKCAVSVPLTLDEAVKGAELVGAPQIDQRIDWIEMIKVMEPGDELRNVWCVPRRGLGGVDIIGLFRNSKLIAEVHTVFMD